MAWKMPQELARRISELATDLTEFVGEKRDEVSEKSETWQESEKGSDVAAWLDELDELAQSMEDAPEEPQA